jgi:hypothetical protein
VSPETLNRIGIAVAVVLGVMGLIAVGFMILMAIALGSMGSNK